MHSSIRTEPKRYLKGGPLALTQKGRNVPRFRLDSAAVAKLVRQVRLNGPKSQEVSILKTPKTIALLAVPAVLAAAIVSATGVFAKAPAHQSAATAPSTATTPAPDVAPTATPSRSAAAPSQAAAPKTESAAEPAEAAEPAGTEANDAAGGHADDPNDPNVDHQFNGEE
jgi:hypothetical protein